MMTINLLQKTMISTALYDIFKVEGISVYTMNESFDDGTPETYGVNWAAYGTVSAEKAVNFSKTLVLASQIAESLTSLKLVIDYVHPDLTEEDRKYIKDTWYPQFLKAMKFADPVEIGEELTILRDALNK